MNATVTQETLALVKATLNDPMAKSVNLGSGLFGVDVSGPVKNLYPAHTPIRNKIARRGGGFGAATNWRQVTALSGSGYNGMPWVAEGQRAAAMSYQSAPKAANYVTLGEEDSYTFEAQSAAQGQGFENEPSMVITRLLQKLMLKEENAIIGGNASLQLGVTPTPTLSVAGSGATLPAATYSVICVALTQEALSVNSAISLTGLLAVGLTPTKTVTGRDGNTFVLNGGVAGKSAAATQAVTLGQSLSASVAAVSGACAYAWYIGTAGNETLQQVTSVNCAVFSAALASGRQNASAITTTDYSANPGLAFDGLLSVALNPLNSAYVYTMPTGTNGVGTGLTSSGRGSCNEIDTAMQAMWDGYQLSATNIYVNSQDMKNLTNKILNSGTSPLMRMSQQVDNGALNPVDIVANARVRAYFNPFMPGGGQMATIEVHPMVPPGTILLAGFQLPPSYQNSQVGNVAEIRTRRDYYQVDWPLRTRQQEFGVYSEEVLAVYAPFAFGVIRNIGNA